MNHKCYADTDEAIRVGHIVMVKEGLLMGNAPGIPTRVEKVVLENRHSHVICENVQKEGENLSSASTIMGKPCWFEDISDLRPATEEERKEYYANKFDSVYHPNPNDECEVMEDACMQQSEVL